MKRLIAAFAVSMALMGFSAGLPASAFEVRDANPIDTEAYLREFHKDPKRVMNAPLLKRDEYGRIIDPSITPFGAAQTSREDVLKARSIVRRKICEASGRSCDPRPTKPSGSFAAYNEANQITGFLFEPTFLRRLIDMESAGLLQYTLKVSPWSDSFWPTKKGMIARRWRDPGYPDANDWLVNYNYYLAVPPILLSTDAMSAAEKYDLVVGDFDFGLTNASWLQGKSSYDQRGNVPNWAGLCHGWAPASYMAANPQRSVTLTAVDGRQVTFNPSDIKALASLAWGEAPPRVNFVGTRCNVNKPKEDAVGRVIDEGCFDINPGTWHMAVVNQVGVTQRSFVFDATYDYQVWNYPINAYQYSYFNPQTFATSKKLSGMMVPISQYTIDKFKAYRSPNAKYVVGVAMDVMYAVPTQPSPNPQSKSLFHTVKYVYDLELDENGVIIGGEWYSNFHPDFIWNPPPNSRPLSTGEKTLPASVAWDGATPLPEELQRAARQSSAKNQPLAAVVDVLVKLAGPTPTPPPAPTPPSVPPTNGETGLR